MEPKNWWFVDAFFSKVFVFFWVPAVWFLGVGGEFPILNQLRPSENGVLTPNGPICWGNRWSSALALEPYHGRNPRFCCKNCHPIGDYDSSNARETYMKDCFKLPLHISTKWEWNPLDPTFQHRFVVIQHSFCKGRNRTWTMPGSVSGG